MLESNKEFDIVKFAVISQRKKALLAYAEVQMVQKIWR